MRVAGISLIGVSIGVWVVATSASTTGQHPLARIAFDSDRGIYTIRADGSDRRLIFRGGGAAPAWSPNGSRIAFSRTLNLRADQSQIWTMRPDGTDRRALTPKPARDVQEITPAWSPDGRRVALIRNSGSYSHPVSSLVTVGAGGRNERTLVAIAGERAGQVASPSWSPDGRRLLYTRVVPGVGVQFFLSLWIVGADGSGRRMLADRTGYGSWSPHGSRIVAVSTRDRNGRSCGEGLCNPNGEIYVMNADGTGQRRLTRNKADDESPVWSPDGAHIAFASSRNFTEISQMDEEIYSIRPDGSCLTWLTNGSVPSRAPTWEPGAARSSDAGGCGAVGRPPLVETQVGRPNPDEWWLGRIAPGGLLLTAVSGGQFFYDDCGNFDPADCPPSTVISNTSACTPDLPNLDRADPARISILRGALFIDGWPDSYSATLFTGETNIYLSELTSSRARARQVVLQLRPVSIEQPTSENMLPPELPGFMWRGLDRVTSAYGRLHDVGRVARALKIRASVVRHRLGVAGRLRALGVTGRLVCGR